VSAQQFSYLAASAVSAVNRIPVFFWAAWILAVLVGTAALAFNAVAPPALGFGRAVALRDPDGHTLEVVQP